MRHIITISLYALIAFMTVSSTNAAEMTLKKLDLPEDKGKEEVEIYCGACHSLRIVVQQRLDKKGWEELLDWMEEEQEMEQIPAEDEKLVVYYLAKHLGLPQKRKNAMGKQSKVSKPAAKTKNMN